MSDRAFTFNQKITLLLLILFAYFMRVLDLTSRSLWFDEAVEFLSAAVPPHLLPQAITAGNYQPPLNIILIHIWHQVDMHPVWLRYLFVSISLLSVLGMVRLTAVLLDQKSALFAGLIMAIMPTEIYYAQDVGEYALLICCLTWSLYFLVQAQRAGSWKYWSAWLILSTLAVYTHYGAAIIVLPVAATTILVNIWLRRSEQLKKQLAVGFIALAGSLPLLLYFLPSQIRRVSNDLSSVQNLLRIDYLSSDFFLGIVDLFSYNLIGYPYSGIEPNYALSFIVLIAVTFFLIWQANYVREAHWLLWFVAAYITYYLLVKIGLYVGFGNRYGLIFTPFYVLAAAALFQQAQKGARRRFLHIGLFILLGLQIYALPQETINQQLRDRPTWQPAENMGELFAYWQEKKTDDEQTYVFYSAVPAFRYYAVVGGLDQEPIMETTPFPICNAQTGRQLCQDEDITFGEWIRHLDPAEKRANFENGLGGRPERVWIFFSHTFEDEHEQMIAELSAHYSIQEQFGDGGESLYLLLLRN
jgi:uncharacterized membrane protein